MNCPSGIEGRNSGEMEGMSNYVMACNYDLEGWGVGVGWGLNSMSSYIQFSLREIITADD